MASYEDYIDVNTGDHHSVVFSEMEYQFEDGTSVDVVPTAAWCFDCNRLVVAEYLDSPDEIESTRMKLKSIISGSTEYVNHFFWPHPPTTSDVENELNRLESYWERFRNRESPARCLTCGGTNIQKTNSNLNDRTEIQGGPILKCTSSGFASIGRVPCVTLNPEGEIAG